MKNSLKVVICLAFVLIFGSFVQAQKIKTMTGTAIKTVEGGRWTGIIIKVGNKKYGVQTSYEPSAGDESRGEKSWQVKTVGTIEVGRNVQIYYTKVDNTFDYEGVNSWLEARKIIVIKNKRNKK